MAIESFALCMTARAGPPARNCVYTRQEGEHYWNLESVTTTHGKDCGTSGFPARVSICSTDHVPVRTAKVHTKFREKLLRRMLDAQRVLGNMVLFHCTTCNNRFPTWHPDKKYHPDFQLQCVRTCSIDVHEWYDAPPPANAQHATVHRGSCARCHKSLQKVAD